ncbi:MAG: hypothetical protein AAB731_00670 [Patescibacteria group bacterium]
MNEEHKHSDCCEENGERLHKIPEENPAQPENLEKKDDAITFKFTFNKKKALPWLLVVVLIVSVAQTIQLLDIKLRLGKGALAAPAPAAQSQSGSSALPKMVGGC